LHANVVKVHRFIATIRFAQVQRNAVDAVDLTDQDTITELVIKNTEVIHIDRKKKQEIYFVAPMLSSK
jgi:hypothetical protein